jgi:GNAT superfamily N-acetyltransferase
MFLCRKAERADVPALLRLMRAYCTYDGIPFEEERQRRGLLVLMGAEHLGAAFLVTKEDELAGYFVLTYGFDLEFGGRVATVTELYILELYRRDGAGLRALGYAEKIARDNGAFALELQAERKNEHALAFYERAGFVRHDRIPMSKRVMSVADLSLVPIQKDGTVAGLGRAPGGKEPLADVLTLTVSLYELEGFTPPWTAYVALDGDVAVGTCAYKSAPKDGEVEIAYFTFPRFEGRGVASWMAQRLVTIAYEHEAQPEIFAQTLPKESASTKILRKLGFVQRDTLLHPEDGLVWEWRQRKF